MPTQQETEALLKQAEKLNQEKNYPKVINLLTDNLLEAHKSAELYIERAKAHNFLGKPFSNTGEYNKAIKDYNKAIKLNPNFASAYFYRGNTWQTKEEYDKAIEDFSMAIKLKPDYVPAYNNRGVAWYRKGEYRRAIKDYTNSIEKRKSPSALPYRNRGNSYYDIGEYEKAISDFEKAIELNSDYSVLQSNINEAKLKLGEKIEAEIKLNEASSFVSDILNEIGDEPVRTQIRNAAAFLVQCMNNIKAHTFISAPIPVSHYTKLNVADIVVMNEGTKLRYSNVVNMNDPEEGRVLVNLLKGAYLDNIKSEDKEAVINKYFAEAKLFEDGDTRDNNIYLGSFLPAPENDKVNSHEDELVMWRTYGKDENRTEAAGCSLVIDPDFFYWPPSPESRQAIREIERMIDTTQKETEIGQMLYKVLYFNRATSSIETKNEIECKKVDEDLEKLKSALVQLINQRKETKEEKSIDNIIYRVLSELRYFFKSSSYAFENEYRIIQYYRGEDKIPNPSFIKGGMELEKINIVKVDNYSPLIPRTLYVESTQPILPHIRKIYIGPKVPNPERWMYLEVVARQRNPDCKLKVLPSSQKFQ